MSIYLASDIHGPAYRERLADPSLQDLTKDDYVIVCGDLEMIDLDEDARAANIAWLEAQPYTTLFVDGNHEEYAVLEQYPESEWMGGKDRRISPSVVFLMRGQVFQLEGRTFFTMGGAPTFMRARLMGLLEGPDPGMPTDAEIAEAERNLERCSWRVDCVLTHCVPLSLAELIFGEGKTFVSPLGEWLDSTAAKLDFGHWFFGHYHCDCQLDADGVAERLGPGHGTFTCVFNLLHRLDDGATFRDPTPPSSLRRRHVFVDGPPPSLLPKQ
ncbi:MAG: metallophosphoesterase family protein [Coriobacteriia bacterium]|nr:metallophosphoesterase family protein [Coriobacteriia bacterium]